MSSEQMSVDVSVSTSTSGQLSVTSSSAKAQAYWVTFYAQIKKPMNLTKSMVFILLILAKKEYVR